jgi:hypothetical protein
MTRRAALALTLLLTGPAMSDDQPQPTRSPAANPCAQFDCARTPGLAAALAAGLPVALNKAMRLTAVSGAGTFVQFTAEWAAEGGVPRGTAEADLVARFLPVFQAHACAEPQLADHIARGGQVAYALALPDGTPLAVPVVTRCGG